VTVFVIGGVLAFRYAIVAEGIFRGAGRVVPGLVIGQEMTMGSLPECGQQGNYLRIQG